MVLSGGQLGLEFLAVLCSEQIKIRLFDFFTREYLCHFKGTANFDTTLFIGAWFYRYKISSDTFRSFWIYRHNFPHLLIFKPALNLQGIKIFPL